MLIASASQNHLVYIKQGLIGYACTCLLAENLGALREGIDKFKPEILLIDFSLCMNNPAALRRYCTTTKVIVLHEGVTEKVEWELLKAGVRGNCKIDAKQEYIRDVVVSVQKGELWMPRSLTSRLIDELGSTTSKNKAYRASFGLLNKLTQREYDIAVRIQNGESNKQIANALGISEQTVKSHLTEIYNKLGVSDRLNLAIALAEDEKVCQNDPQGTVIASTR